MNETGLKQKIIQNICYTELVYARINKKLKTQLSKEQIEGLLVKALNEANEKFFLKRGKNYYISNAEMNIRITVNSNTYRIITVDKISPNS